MDWFSLALIGTITTAVANIIDKYLLEKRIRNLYIPVIVDGLLAAVFVLALWFTFPIQSISAELLFWNLVSGALFTYVLIFYFKAVQSDDVSRIIPLFNLLPLFVVVVSVIFFGYVFETIHYAGIILLFGGAWLASVKDIQSPRLSKGLLLALAVVVIGGATPCCWNTSFKKWTLCRFISTVASADFWQQFPC